MQFDDDLRPLPQLRQLAEIQDEAGLSAVELHELMINPDVGADGELGTDRDRLLTAAVPRSIHVEFDLPGAA